MLDSSYLFLCLASRLTGCCTKWNWSKPHSLKRLLIASEVVNSHSPAECHVPTKGRDEGMANTSLTSIKVRITLTNISKIHSFLGLSKLMRNYAMCFLTFTDDWNSSHKAPGICSDSERRRSMQLLQT